GLGAVARSAILQGLLWGVKLGWEFTPAYFGLGSGLEKRIGDRRRGQKPTLLLLHGFLGSKADWRGKFSDLATADGHDILSIDLPGHGESESNSMAADFREEVEWGLGGVDAAADAVGEVCDAAGLGPYLVVGYSLGGRVALSFAQRRMDLLQGGGLVLVSANPGLTSTSERLSRWASDMSLATEISALSSTRLSSTRLSSASAAVTTGIDGAATKLVKASAQDSPISLAKPSISCVTSVGSNDNCNSSQEMDRSYRSEAHAFLERWYSAGIWGGLAQHRPQEFEAMIRRRLDLGLLRAGGMGAHYLSASLLATSVARQPDYWPLLRGLGRGGNVRGM
ncbi:unnamed protein product, partial [Discosporangium mesarthrocarpum]